MFLNGKPKTVLSVLYESVLYTLNIYLCRNEISQNTLIRPQQTHISRFFLFPCDIQMSSFHTKCEKKTIIYLIIEKKITLLITIYSTSVCT